MCTAAVCMPEQNECKACVLRKSSLSETYASKNNVG
jgi:hypothetical protein